MYPNPNLKEYRGFRYDPYEERDDDVTKLFHDIRYPNGVLVEFKTLPDWFAQISPYRHVTQSEFERAVDEIRFLEFVYYGC